MIRRPYTILFLLTGLNLLNYVDRILLSAVLPRIKESLGLSDFASGSLATIFLVGYFVTSPIFGRLADRGARKGLIAAGVAVWSAATAASGLAQSAIQLVGARAVVGVGEASYATIAPTIIDDLAPSDRKARWLAVFYVAIPVGSALGYLLGGFFEHRYGWRSTFFLVGGPGVLLALLCLAIAEPARKLQREHVDLRAAFRSLWRLDFYRKSVLGYAAQTFAIGGFAFWAPTFLYRQYSMPLNAANYKFGLVTIAAGVIGTAVGGVWSDRKLRAIPNATDDDAARVGLRICALGGFVAAPMAVACFLAPTNAMFFAFAFVCELAIFLSTSPINAAILRSVPVEARASAMALSIFAIHALGDLWSPPLLGVFMDHMPIGLAMMGVPLAIAVSALVWWKASSHHG